MFAYPDSFSRRPKVRRRVWNASLTLQRSASRGIRAKLVGQKSPLRLKEIWAIRILLQLSESTRELALNLAVDSSLRSCDLVRPRVEDLAHSDQVARSAIVMQQKTRRPVQFEITEQTRDSVSAWIRCANRRTED